MTVYIRYSTNFSSVIALRRTDPLYICIYEYQYIILENIVFGVVHIRGQIISY
jgi:hypothetical protein